MRYSTGIEFRAQTEMPNNPGWYYAYPHWSDELAPIPTLVETLGARLFIRQGPNKLDLYEFDWFGPVREVREASDGC